MSALQPVNSVNYTCAATFSAPALNGTFGPMKQYFTATAQTRAGAQTSDAGTRTTDDYLYAIATFAAGTGNQNNQFILHDKTLSHTLVNNNLGPCYITMYYCINRRDVYGTTVATTLLTDGWISNSQSLTVSAASAPSFLTPFMSGTFVENYRIYKTKTLKLMPGETHTVSLSDRKRRMIKEGRFVLPSDQTTTALTVPITYQSLRGNKFILFSIAGSVGNSILSHTAIGTTQPEIDITTKMRMKFQWISDTTPTIFYQNQTGFTSGIANIQLVDPISGTIVTEANA